jgi:hypothetical protein
VDNVARHTAPRLQRTPLPPAPPRRDYTTVAVGHLADYPIVVGGAVSGAAYVFGPRDRR